MGKTVALFIEKKIKSIEFYRSEAFGEENEEIWCEIDCQGTDSYNLNLYRKGVLAYSSEIKMEFSPLWCFHNGIEQPIITSRFREEKTQVASTKELHRDVLHLIEQIEFLFEMGDHFAPLTPSPLYGERKCKSDTNMNQITINYTNGTQNILKMDLDSDLRMCCARYLDVIPTVYNCFIGGHKLRKITEENLEKSEANELHFMKECTLYTSLEIEYITDHMFRDEKGTVFYTVPNMMGVFELHGH